MTLTSIMILLTLGAALLLLVMMVVSDVKNRLISNRLSILFFVASCGVVGLSVLGGHLSTAQAMTHIYAFMIAFAVCFGLFALGVMGGGDAKVIPSVVLIAGGGYVVPFLFFMAVAGGLIAGVLLVKRRMGAGAQQGHQTVPYAVAIMVGALPVFGHIGQMILKGGYHGA